MRLAIACLLVFASFVRGQDPLPPLDPVVAASIRYQSDVLPIFKRHCLGCHNARDAQGGLDMTQPAAFLKGGRSGPAFVPGKPDESLLVHMLTGQKTPAMPYKQPALNVVKIQTLRHWLLAGGKMEMPPAIAVSSPPELYPTPPEITALAFSRDGGTLAVACRSEVILLAPTGGAIRQRLAIDGDLVTFVGFSPDGGTLALAGGMPGEFGEVRFYDFADGKATPRHRHKIGTDTLFRGAFAPQRPTLALGGADGAVYLFPLEGDDKPAKLELHSDWVSEVAYSGDGKLLLTGSRDKAVKAVQVETGQVLRVVATLGEGVTGVALTPGFALSVCREKALNAFDLKRALGEVALLGTGNNVVPTGNSAEYTRKLETLPGEVNGLAIDPSRRRVAVVGRFSDVRVYEVPGGEKLGAVSGLTAPVNVAAWSSDGKWFAVGTQSGRVALIDGERYKVHAQFVPAPVK